MARKLKPNEAGEYVNQKYKVRIPILLDREDKTFFAKFGVETFFSDTFAKTKSLLHEYVEAALKFEWKPFIQVDSNVLDNSSFGSDKYDSMVGLSIERMWLADKPGDDDRRSASKKLKVAWEHMDQGGVEKTDIGMFGGTLDYAKHYYDDETTACLIPYTEERWKALEIIKVKIDQAHDQLKVLLTLQKEELHVLLEQIAQALPSALIPAHSLLLEGPEVVLARLQKK